MKFIPLYLFNGKIFCMFNYCHVIPLIKKLQFQKIFSDYGIILKIMLDLMFMALQTANIYNTNQVVSYSNSYVHTYM